MKKITTLIFATLFGLSLTAYEGMMNDNGHGDHGGHENHGDIPDNPAHEH